MLYWSLHTADTGYMKMDTFSIGWKKGFSQSIFAICPAGLKVFCTNFPHKHRRRNRDSQEGSMRDILQEISEEVRMRGAAFHVHTHYSLNISESCDSLQHLSH